MTIHQLRHEFGEKFYLDNAGQKTGYVQSMNIPSKAVWFMRHLQDYK
ncbi:MAG: hypothetical protein SCK29_14625 [Bacillota bacterium]|nr:hypothetical protein [Bacillota bacterium]